MERWEFRERLYAVGLFIRTGFVVETQHGFYHEMNRHEAPSSNEILRWVKQWRDEGSVSCRKPLYRPYSVPTPKNIAQVFASVGSSPRLSASRQLQAVEMCDANVRLILHSDFNKKGWIIFGL
jgi:hypothetical protein